MRPGVSINRFTLSEVTSDVQESDLREFLADTDGKVIEFLTENQTYYNLARNQTGSFRECISTTDRAFMDNYILEALSELSANYVLDELEIVYPARVERVDQDDSAQRVCRSR
jgi:hypothetical protein